MTFRVARRDTLDDCLLFSYAREDIFERIDGKCHVFTI
jgi:hypothetical protein